MKFLDAWVVYDELQKCKYYFETKEKAEIWAYSSYMNYCSNPEMIKCIMDEDGNIYPLPEPITFK